MLSVMRQTQPVIATLFSQYKKAQRKANVCAPGPRRLCPRPHNGRMLVTELCDNTPCAACPARSDLHTHTAPPLPTWYKRPSLKHSSQ